jgi:hypothetical protein
MARALRGQSWWWCGVRTGMCAVHWNLEDVNVPRLHKVSLGSGTGAEIMV